MNNRGLIKEKENLKTSAQSASHSFLVHFLAGRLEVTAHARLQLQESSLSNRRFDVLLDGTRLPHTTNLNAFILTPAVRVRALKERKYQLPVAIFDVRDVNVLVT